MMTGGRGAAFRPRRRWHLAFGIWLRRSIPALLADGWLFMNSLDNVRALEKLVAFHVQQHNQVMPHSAFRGQTPDEVYFGTGACVTAELTAARAGSRRERVAANRALSCSICEPESRVKSASVQLRPADY